MEEIEQAFDATKNDIGNDITYLQVMNLSEDISSYSFSLFKCITAS